jgi:hypothetical protein
MNDEVIRVPHGPDFLASDFIHEDELGPLLKKAERGGRLLRLGCVSGSFGQLSDISSLFSLGENRFKTSRQDIMKDCLALISGNEPLT